MKARLIPILILALLGLVGCVPALPVAEMSEAEPVPLVEEPPDQAPQEKPESAEVVIEQAQSFDRSAFSVDEPDSLWVIVNKARPFNPIDYHPPDLVAPNLPSNYSPLLRAEVAEALEALHQAAQAEGLGFTIHSSYRSYSVQQRVKRASLERLGSEDSDARSARAGHSEHQSGLAVDLTTPQGTCTLQECFGETAEGRWLFDNSWRFGFVQRYLEGKTEITGYIYEPWHFRYVGIELATEIWNQGYPTLEEFFGLDPAPHYAE